MKWVLVRTSQKTHKLCLRMRVGKEGGKEKRNEPIMPGYREFWQRVTHETRVEGGVQDL